MKLDKQYGIMINFAEVLIGQSFWEPIGNKGEWFPSCKVDSNNARYQTHCGLVYGESYTVPSDKKVKVFQ